MLDTFPQRRYRICDLLKRTPAVWLMPTLLLVGLTSVVAAQDDAPAPAPPEPTAQHPEPAVDLGSPRATVETFLAAMNEVRAGKEDRLDRALACIYLDPAVFSEQDRFEQGADIAQELFEILDSTTIDLERVPEEFEGDDYQLKLGRDQEVTLHRYRDDGGAWRFSHKNTVERLDELHEEIVEQAEDAPPPTANPKLASPRATMKTFIEGINRWDEGGDADAVSALDLSKIDAPVRDAEAVRLARMLKDVLDRHEKVIYQKIPNDPDQEAPYVYLEHPKGTIVLAPVKDEETGETAWKFSPATLDGLPGLRDAFMAKALVVEEAGGGPEVRSVMLRDWVAANFPFLIEKQVLIENWQWLGLLLIIFVGFVVSHAFALLLLLVLHGAFRRQDVELDVHIEKEFVRPIRVALMAWVWWLGLSLLGLPPKTLAVLLMAAKCLTVGAGVWAFYRLIDLLGDYLHKKAMKTETRFDDLLVPLVTRTLKVFTMAFGLVFIAEALTLPVKSLLAGLGLGGLAFALAAKDTIANIFGSLTVLLDRPFQIGDWVVIGDVEGTVEGVGIRSTRVRTFYNSLISVPNAQLISATIDNLGARRYRRIKMMIAVAYDTPPEKIDAFCAGIRQIIREHPYTRKDYYHVWLNEFGGTALNILLYCFHETPDWATELRERHRLFLDIIRLATRLGVEFAFPTQTLYVRQSQAPEHGPIDFSQAQVLGKREATRIVDEFQGGKDAPTPRPVEFEPGSSGPQLSAEEARELGADADND